MVPERAAGRVGAPFDLHACRAAMPGLRQRDRARGGRGRLRAAPAACSARRSASRRSCISRSGARSTSKAWATSWSTSWSTAGWSARCPTCTGSASRALARLERMGEKSAAEPARGLEKAQARRRWRAFSTGSASAMSARPPPRTWPGTSARSTACMDASVEQLLEVARRRPDRGARASTPSSPSRTTARWSSSCAPPACTWPEHEGTAARRGAAAAGRQDLRADRHAADADARRGQGADRGGRRQGRRLGVEEDRLRGRRRRGRQQARQGAGARHCRCSTRTGCAGCSTAVDAQTIAMIPLRPPT